MSTVVYQGKKFEYGQTTMLSDGDGPCPHIVIMPHVDLKGLKRTLKRWGGPWRVHSAWALDSTDLDAYLMVTFQELADKRRYELALSKESKESKEETNGDAQDDANGEANGEAASSAAE
jgi:hypothetical protein